MLLEGVFVAKDLLVGLEQVRDVLVLLEDQTISTFTILRHFDKVELHLVELLFDLLEELVAVLNLLNLLCVHDGLVDLLSYVINIWLLDLIILTWLIIILRQSVHLLFQLVLRLDHTFKFLLLVGDLVVENGDELVLLCQLFLDLLYIAI